MSLSDFTWTEEMVASLSLDEKASLLDGMDAWRTQQITRLGIPAITMSDGPHGLRRPPESNESMGLDRAQVATCFPTAVALASTWDRELLAEIGAALGREASAAGVGLLLGPGVNMKRSPLCGRNFEYFSEDPYLTGELAVAYIRALQEMGVGACVKHFAVNNQEKDRLTISAEVDERPLHEIYLRAFEQIIQNASPWAVMSSYNRINGEWASQSRWLLTDLLRDRWGFDGVVVSDWGAVDSRVRGVAAGLDVEMPSSSGEGTEAIIAAVEGGSLQVEDVDAAVARVLGLVSRAMRGSGQAPSYRSEEHHLLARRAAVRSGVLLKNEDSMLPLRKQGGKLAVVGELAVRPRFQGGGSSRVTTSQVDEPLASLRSALDGSREVGFASGYLLDQPETAGQMIQEAVELARSAEDVVLFMGLPESWESEGYDREHMDVPPVQVRLLEEISRVNDRVSVVLLNGSAVTVTPWQDLTKALLEMGLCGEGVGYAIAELLLGESSPSGRLAETIPLRYLDSPAVGNFPGERGAVRYGEGLLIGYRWYDTRELEVAYPFGHGLTYTTFEYSDLTAAYSEESAEPGVTLGFGVSNVGDREAIETVQIYVHAEANGFVGPEQELRQFVRVPLAPGATERVSVRLSADAFSFWNPDVHDWQLAPGHYEVRVGASSRDIRLSAPIHLPGTVMDPPTALSTVGYWLDHPVGGPLLREKLAGSAFDGVLEEFPLERLRRFPGFPLDAAGLDELLTRVGTPL